MSEAQRAVREGRAPVFPEDDDMPVFARAEPRDVVDDLDAAVEAEVRAAYEGREGEMIWTEAEDGIAERMTAREMFDGFERDLDDFEALKVCVG